MNLDSSISQRVHSTRIIVYGGEPGEFDVSDQLLNLANRTIARYCTIDRLIYIDRNVNGDVLIRVGWDRLPGERDWTRHLATYLHKDVPELFIDFLQTQKRGKTEEPC